MAIEAKRPSPMATLIRWVTGRDPARATPALSFDDWVSYFTYNSQVYATGLNQTMVGNREEIATNFTGLVSGAYKSNGIVFACIQARLMLLSQARFQWQRMKGGTPGDLFGTQDLALLEHPEPGKVTADLLARASVDVDLAGNHFLARRFVAGSLRLKRLRPDWVTIVLGSPNDPQLDARDLDAEVIGYAYLPGGRGSGIDPVFLLREEVAHLAPIPDPIAHYRGMSWLTPLIRDVQSDSAATSHKELFFENGATPNMVLTRSDSPTREAFNEWVSMVEEGHTGLANAYKTLYLTAGATAEVVGANMQQLEFRATQGAGETRIATASGIHPVILGISEGLSGSSLNQGNFMAARRLTADKALRPFWGNFASSLEVIMPPPSGARLWYDDKHIPFLAEDVKDAAEVQNLESQTIRTLVDAGYLPDSVVAAVSAQDWSLLDHSELYSVQLQPPMPEGPQVPTPVTPPEIEAGRAMLQLAQAAIEQRVQPILSDGAIRIDSPVTVESPQIHFPEGFVRSETPVTVEPTNVTIEKGAIQVDAPVTVEPAQVTIEEGAIRSETPVTVTTPERGKRSVRIERDGDNVRLVEDDVPAG